MPRMKIWRRYQATRLVRSLLGLCMQVPVPRRLTHWPRRYSVKNSVRRFGVGKADQVVGSFLTSLNCTLVSRLTSWSPDLTGWRRKTLPEMPTEAAFTTAPDWVCEVLSPSTGTLDRIHKVPVFALHKVAHVWLVDPVGRSIEVLRLDGDSYRLARMIDSKMKTAAIEPFDAIEIDVQALWQWTQD